MKPEDFLRIKRGPASDPVRTRTGGMLVPTRNLREEEDDEKCGYAAAEFSENVEEAQCDVLGDDRDTPRMLFSGRVLDTFGCPIENAVVDVWQAKGEPGDDEFLAARVATGSNGVFQILIKKPQKTQAEKDIEKPEQPVAPAAPRPQVPTTPHINVRVWFGDNCALQTRLFFRDVPINTTDAMYNDERVIAECGADTCSFDLVIDVDRANSSPWKMQATKLGKREQQKMDNDRADPFAPHTEVPVS